MSPVRSRSPAPCVFNNLPRQLPIVSTLRSIQVGSVTYTEHHGLPKRPGSTFACFAYSNSLSLLHAKGDPFPIAWSHPPQTPAAPLKRLYPDCPTGDSGDSRPLRAGAVPVGLNTALQEIQVELTTVVLEFRLSPGQEFPTNEMFEADLQKLCPSRKFSPVNHYEAATACHERFGDGS